MWTALLLKRSKLGISKLTCGFLLGPHEVCHKWSRLLANYCNTPERSYIWISGSGFNSRPFHRILNAVQTSVNNLFNKNNCFVAVFTSRRSLNLTNLWFILLPCNYLWLVLNFSFDHDIRHIHEFLLFPSTSKWFLSLNNRLYHFNNFRQLYENYKTKNFHEACSPYFLLLWLIGDTANLVRSFNIFLSHFAKL